MAVISQTIFSDAFHEWKILYFDQIWLKFVPKGPIINNIVSVIR